MIEKLESRWLMSATVAPNPGMPQSVHSGNLVAQLFSSVTGDGQAISQGGQAGTQSVFVQDLLIFSGIRS